MIRDFFRDYKGEIIACVIIVGILVAIFIPFLGGASCQRACVSFKSNLQNGLDRTIKVYTANGDIIAEYHGKIDLEANDGGYVVFDFEGKRYIYYNCFVESIADIN